MPTLSTPREIEVHRHESPLGCWEHAAWAPPDLAGVVEAMWYFDGRVAHRRERIFPSGRPELVVHLDDVYREAGVAGGRTYPRVCVTGQMLRPLVIEAPGRRTAVLGVRLEAAGACLVLGGGLHELTNGTADLADVLGPCAAELEERCGAARGAAGRLRTAADWVRARIHRFQAPDPAVAWAAGVIEQAPGRVSISSLRTRTGWSKTRFTTTFREQVGVPPKGLARIARFRRALTLLHDERERLSGIALSCGYYDQAHFGTEFRAMSGVAPSQYRSALRYPNSVSLAEHGPADG
jgi:AraC-like DNA-binding protein